MLKHVLARQHDGRKTQAVQSVRQSVTWTQPGRGGTSALTPPARFGGARVRQLVRRPQVCMQSGLCAEYTFKKR